MASNANSELLNEETNPAMQLDRDRYPDLKPYFEHIDKGVKSLTNMANKFSDEVKILRGENEDIKNELESLKATLIKEQLAHNAEVNMFGDKLHTKQAEVSKLVSDVDRLKEENRCIREKDAAEIMELKLQKQAEAEKNRNLTDLVAKLEQQNGTAQSEISQQNSVIAQLQEIVDKNKAEIVKVVCESNSRKLELDQRKTEYLKEKQVIVDLQEQLNSLNKVLYDNTAQFQARQSELESQVEDLRRTSEQLTAELEVKQTNVDQMSWTIQNYEDEVTAIKKRTSDQETLINTLQSQNSTLKAEKKMLADDWKEKLETSETAREKVSVKLSAAEAAAYEAGCRKKVLGETINNMQEEVKRLSSQLSDSELESRVLAKKVEEEKKELIEKQQTKMTYLESLLKDIHSQLNDRSQQGNNNQVNVDCSSDSQMRIEREEVASESPRPFHSKVKFVGRQLMYFGSFTLFAYLGSKVTPAQNMFNIFDTKPSYYF